MTTLCFYSENVEAGRSSTTGDVLFMVLSNFQTKFAKLIILCTVIAINSSILEFTLLIQEKSFKQHANLFLKLSSQDDRKVRGQ